MPVSKILTITRVLEPPSHIRAHLGCGHVNVTLANLGRFHTKLGDTIAVVFLLHP